MATTKTTQVGQTSKSLQDQTEGVNAAASDPVRQGFTPNTDGRTEQASETADNGPGAPSPHDPRTTVPSAPRGLMNERSRVAVARWQQVLAAAVGDRRPQASAMRLQQLEQEAVVGYHPDALSYRAEVVDFLRGRAANGQ